MAASPSLSRRGGSGSRALPPASPGRSAAKATSTSPLPAIARRQTETARLNGSVGASFAGVLGLMLEDMAARCGFMLAGKEYIFQSDRVRDLNMAEPESHTLHLLREIREDIRRVDRKVDTLQDTVNGLSETVAGELAIRGYIVGGVESRLADIERRLAALEQG